MKTKPTIIVISMILMLLCSLIGTSLAEVLIITPEAAAVQVRGQVKFDVQSFTMMQSGEKPSASNMMGSVEWRVEPEWLGKIEDGFFMAGDKPGKGLIIATMKSNQQEFRAEAVIHVGDRQNTAAVLPELEIIPADTALDFGEKVQFRAVLKYPNTNNEVSALLNWTVKPRNLGTINQKGEFVAGDVAVAGHVVAYVDFMGSRIYGKSYVVVGAKANAAISGTVTDEDNQVPLGDAVVSAQRIGFIHWHQRTLSDNSGNYILANLIPGWYVVHVKKQGFISEYYDDVQYFVEATPVQTAADDTTESIDFELSHGGAIAGTIYSSEDSSVLGNTHLMAFLAVKPGVRYHALSDDNGNYTISGLHSGSYVVHANKEGYQGEYYDDAVLLANATPVAVTQPDTTEAIDFALGMKSAIAGTVVSDVDGSPVEGARVSARTLNHLDWKMAHHVRTNENGEYVLQLPAGNYVVRVEADSFNTEFYDDVYDPALATPVAVNEDQHTTAIDFSLAPLSKITGTVTDESTAAPIVDAVVWAFPEVGGNPAKIRTDENGAYELNRLKPGIYFVKAWAEGYYQEFWQEAQRLADATPISVGYNEVIENIDFTLSAASSISGTVVSDEDNSPISRALIIAQEMTSNVQHRTFSNELGEYTIKGLAAGSYYVLAIANGYYREYYDDASTIQDATPVELAESEAKTGIDFALTPAPANQGAITGIITADADELPIAGAFVAALPMNGGMPQFGVTNSEGEYALKGLSSGKYYVMAWAMGFIGEFYDDVHHWKKATPVEVISPNSTSNIDFGLKQKPVGPYTIRGRIHARKNQAPVANALVYAFQHQQGVVGFGITDANGNYIIPEMPAGQYKLVASFPGMVQNNDANTSTQDSLSVELGAGEDESGADIVMDEDLSTDVSGTGESMPQSFALNQNYPNPFPQSGSAIADNPETNIHFVLPEAGNVTLRIFNVLGQQITTLVNEKRIAGNYTLKWNGKNQFGQTVPTGIYFYQLQVKNARGVIFDQIRKMTIMR